MWKRLAVVAAAACVVGMTPTEAEACSCIPPNLIQSYNNAEASASVRIVSKATVGQKWVYRARVIANYKGCYKRGQTIFVESAASGAACGVSLEKGKVYLLNGDIVTGVFGKPALHVGLCGYNVPWSALSADQKDWLRGRWVCCDGKCACADGQPPVQCFVDPCMVNDCPTGTCEANYCGGCLAEFYTEDGLAWCNPCDGDEDCAWNQHCSAAGECVGGCTTDADCPGDQWCSPTQGGGTECKPFQQEGEWCGGFTPVWAQSKCAPGLVCTDFPPFIADAPGTCRAPCKEDSDCGSGQYCSSSGYCRDDGACWENTDCNLAGNHWPHIECVGYGYCGDDGQCGWECGVAECQDLSDVFFGFCDMLLGVAIVDGSCQYVSGCDDYGYSFFNSMDACNKACGCLWGGVAHAPGDVWPAGDGCNDCSCDAGGGIYCTKKPCLVGCEHNGAWYEFGESFPAGDGCNTCICLEDGGVACTLMACPKGCLYEGEWYEPGTSFPAGDGCNTCYCMEDGSVACTEMACPQGCTHNGVWYAAGESFPAGDGCNTCTCQGNGMVLCTLMACIQTCEYGGETYLPGDTFPAGDGCNECMCGEDGLVGCTKKACIPDGCTIEYPCEIGWDMCWAPGEQLPCGMCFVPEPWMMCQADSDCGVGQICDWDDNACLCWPEPMCVPACSADSDCEVGESCGNTGHCEATACAAQSDCPLNFDCTNGACQRQKCTSSSDCFAWCVKGYCHDAPGYCSPPPP